MRPFRLAPRASAACLVVLAGSGVAYASEQASADAGLGRARAKASAPLSPQGLALRLASGLARSPAAGGAPVVAAGTADEAGVALAEEVRRLELRLAEQQKQLDARGGEDLARIGEHLELQRQILARLDRRMRELEAKAVQPQAGVVAGAGDARPDAGRQVSEARREVESALASQKEPETGPWSIDMGLNYARTDRRQLTLNGFLALDAIFLGNISVDNVKSDVFTLDTGLRYRPNRRWQFDLQAPLVMRTALYQSAGANNATNVISEARVSSADLGDASVGASYLAFAESGWRPDIYLNARVKAPTGSHPYGVKLQVVPGSGGNLSVPERLPSGNGLWSYTVGASLVKSLSPATMYGSLAYQFNGRKHFGDISSAPGTVSPGTVALGNALLWSAGSAFALNERLSLSAGFSQRLQGRSKTRLDGAAWSPIVGSEGNAGTVSFGAAYAIDGANVLSGNVGVGITPDAPNFSIGLRYSKSL